MVLPGAEEVRMQQHARTVADYQLQEMHRCPTACPPCTTGQCKGITFAVLGALYANSLASPYIQSVVKGKNGESWRLLKNR